MARTTLSRVYHALLLLGCLSLLAFVGQAQRTYQLNLGTDLGLVAIGGWANYKGSLLWGTIDIGKRASEVSYGRLTAFEGSLSAHGRPRAGRLSDVFRDVGKFAPTALLALPAARREGLPLGIMLAETCLLSSGLTTVLKAGIRRPRPYVYFGASDGVPLEKYDQTSFVSGHTSASATGAFFVASVFEDLYPNSKLRPYVWAAAITVPAVTGMLRVRAGRHYVSDVICGYAIGAAAGCVVPWLHRVNEKMKRVEVNVAGNGLAGSFTF